MQVREATANIPDVWINLAHINLLQRQYENAIRLYQTCLRDFYNGSDATVLLYLSKAYFEDGRLEECKATLQKALRLTPWNVDLWYNLALALKENAIKLSNKLTTNATKMAQAISDYQAAIPILEKLSTPDPSTRRGYSTTKCLDFLRSSKANLNIAYDNYKELKETEEIRNREIEEKRLRAEQVVQARMRKKEEEEKHKLDQQAQLEVDAEQMAKQTRHLVSVWEKEKEKPTKKKAPKKKRKAADILGLGDSGDEAENNEGNTSPTRVASSLEQIKQARNRKGKRKSTDGEETEAKPKRKRLSKKKQQEEAEEERPEEDFEGMAMHQREDDVLLFEESDGGEAQE